MNTSKETLIFGGSFDPVHNGHISIAKAIADVLRLSEVIIVPTVVNPLKTHPGASGEERKAMLQLATQDDSRLIVSDIEISRKPPIYTIDTIEKMLKDEMLKSKPLFLIGADSLDTLSKWKRIDDLIEKVKFIVACRPPKTKEEILSQINDLRVTLSDRLDIHCITTESFDISSSDIRDSVSRGFSISGKVPDSVEKYIQDNRLYRKQE